MTVSISRRSILLTSAAVAASGLAGKVSAQTTVEQKSEGNFEANTASDVTPKEPDFKYSVRKTEAEWRAKLSEVEYRVLREGKTEKKKSSPLWKEERPGAYRCKGCDLRVYSSVYKVNLNKGWVFFRQSEPDSVLLGIDLVTGYGRREKRGTAMEVHCRRCGSHFGHILNVKNEILHCVNGAALSLVAG